MGVKIELEKDEITTIKNALSKYSQIHSEAIINEKFAGKKLSKAARGGFVIAKGKIDKLLNFFRTL